MLIEDKKNKIAMLALVTGEQYIGQVGASDSGTIELIMPLTIYPIHDEKNGRINVQFIPPVPYVIEPGNGEYKIEFSRATIGFTVYEEHINDDILGAYRRSATKAKTGLEIPTSKIIT